MIETGKTISKNKKSKAYAEYREKVKECRISGKGTREWCEEHKIAYETMRTWIKRVHQKEGYGELEKEVGREEGKKPKQYAEYRQLVKECRSSGQSGVEWCAANGILYTTYCTWRKKVLRKENKDDFDRECGLKITHGRQPEPKISENPPLCELRR